MLRNENSVAAKRLVDSLRTTITTSAESLEDLKRSFDRRPTANLSELKNFCNTMRKDVDQLHKDMNPFQSLTKAPDGGELLDAGFGQMDEVDKILDMFESRLEEAYGIEVTPAPEAETLVASTPSASVTTPQARALETDDKRTPAEMSTPAPRARVSPNFEECMPATPKLEDFGISRADLEALESVPEGRGMDTPAGLDKIEIGSGDYGEAVAKSMSKLGIETPVQVADKFSARRHIALKGVMPGTTPKMAGGRVLDYTGLAGGYYERRRIEFGEEDGLKERYESATGFWKDSVTVDDAVKAGDCVRHVAGLTQDEVVEIVKKGMPGCDALAVLVGLAKMKVLAVSKPENGDAVYRYRG